MIVDAHVHIWKAHPEYPDPSETVMSPLSEVPLSLLRDYMDENGVGRAVLVQPIYAGEDNSLVADAARAEPDRYAAVCVVDPRSPEAPDRLTDWVRVRGCRGLRLRPVRKGEEEAFESAPLWDRARELRIPVSVLARQEHVPRIGAMAERYPEVPVIVDHMAHPDAAAGPEAPAFRALLDLSHLPNVHVKPTGFYYVTRTDYPYPDCAGFFRALLDRYGPRRLVWGTDFPHVLLRTGYRRSVLLFERAFPEVSAADRALIMGGNAGRLYWGSRL